MQYDDIQSMVQSRLSDSNPTASGNLLSISFRLDTVDAAMLDVLAKHLGISRSQMLVDLCETAIPDIRSALMATYDKNDQTALKADIQAAMDGVL